MFLNAVPIPLLDYTCSGTVPARDRERFLATERPFWVSAHDVLPSHLATDFLNASSENPLDLLFIYGPSGSGKTHYAQGLYVTYMMRYPRIAGRVLSALDFSRLWSETLKSGNTSDFHARFLKLNIFVLEDIQNIATNFPVQEELIYILDILGRHGTQFIFTSGAPLSHLPTLRPSLSDRIKSGVTLHLDHPDENVRRAILSSNEIRSGMKIQQSALDLVARQTSTVPEMLGIIKQLEMRRRITRNTEITSDDVTTTLEARKGEKTLTPHEIAKATGKFFGVTLADMRSASRLHGIVQVRGIACYLIRNLTGSTFSEIGKYFGGRDHTTMLYSYQQTELRIHTDKELEATIQELMQKFSSR